MPIKARAGETYARWAAQLERLGYRLEKRILNAADFGAPTSRKRIFIVARRDGLPIRWPEPSHGKGRANPWRTAAECIDWSIPCPSIFDRKKPLAEATMARIARGIKRYVLDDPRPFIVRIGQTGGNGKYTNPVSDPLTTVTTKAEHCVVSPVLAGCGGRAGQSEPRSGGDAMYTITKKADTCLITPTLVQTSYGEREGQAPRSLDLHKPLGTVVAGGQKHALVTGFLAKHYGGVVGQPIEAPVGTITSQDHHAPVAVHLTKFYGSCKDGVPADQPAPTVTNGGGRGGGHAGIVAAHLTHYHKAKRDEARASSLNDPQPTQTVENRFGLVYAFLAKYYGTAVGQVLEAPLDTITGKDRFGVVTVTIDGQEYAIADIGMRMLQPHELAKAQGFPDEYHLIGTKSEQVAKIGNSVCPPVAEALVRANLVTSAAERMKETA
jgi:DNA (cytosine-5)-methyltransferase 1